MHLVHFLHQEFKVKYLGPICVEYTIDSSCRKYYEGHHRSSHGGWYGSRYIQGYIVQNDSQTPSARQEYSRGS